MPSFPNEMVPIKITASTIIKMEMGYEMASETIFFTLMVVK
jgi:hypothetical protein